MHSILKIVFQIIIISLSFTFLSSAQNFKIIESTSDHITIEFNFNNSYFVYDTLVDGRKYNVIKGDENYYRNPGDPWLPLINLNVGIPHNSNPTIQIIKSDRASYSNKFIMPYPETDPIFEKPNVEKINKEVYSKSQFFPIEFVQLNPSYDFRYAEILPIAVSPYQFNPVTRELVFNNKFLVKVNFNVRSEKIRISLSDAMTDGYLESAVINAENAKNWISKPTPTLDSPLNGNDSWYNPDKNYFKFYLKEKGVYRVTYSELISAGVPLGSETPLEKIELFNTGSSVPIDIRDINSDQLFNENDYIQFVGFPPPSSPNAYMNIFNLSNVYWFSFESDSNGSYYNIIDGYPRTGGTNYVSSRKVLHYEEDKIFERMGYSSTADIDHWFWGKSTGIGGQVNFGFEHIFNEFPNRTLDSNRVTLRVAMHGMTNNQWCSTDHKAYIDITDQRIGIAYWDGQEEKIFERSFYISSDSIHIFPLGNRLNVWVTGEMCNAPLNNDEIRINWVEFEYWMINRANVNHFTFKAPAAGFNKLWLTQWLRNNMDIYIPEKNKLINNALITGDNSNTVIFIDTSDVGTEYFCVASDYHLSLDSIVQDQPSNLRDISNGADYIIITHPDFLSTAQELADFRSNNFPDPDIENARTVVVDVMQIYDEFSNGLLDPNALRDFVKYAFQNWQSPAPSYVALMGDMSYDYRGILENSYKNFVPSMKFFAFTYGWSASDNLIVAISGSDVIPDLAIGRISCETLEEANILVNKIIQYPDDNTKPWKQNNIFLASGLSEDDENQFGFNDASLLLANTYVIPQGYKATFVFRYPTKPQHEPHQGGGPRMREEINEGAALVNYYGHGGGLQWDLVFLDDDIDLLENGGRLPVVISVTCYTAHFDNQKGFGEHFNLVENKGSIGFYGSSGLTYWGIGKSINNKLFNEIFVRKNLIIGKAILNSKNQVPSSGIYATQINLLTYLGDPALGITLPLLPDFIISSSDIAISPENPLVNDTVTVKVNIMNVGRAFPNDSVTVELLASSSDTSYQVGLINRPNFGEKDSVYFTWIPTKGNLYKLTAKVNETAIIDEMDHSDNIASQFFLVFNLSEPNVLKPIDAFSTDKPSVKFLFSDPGYYGNKNLIYTIKIDTSISFESPLISSPELTSTDAIVEWQSPNLSTGVYFWRARIFDGTEYGNWSAIRSFSITENVKNGYFAHQKILDTFTKYNIEYSDSSKSLMLNTDPLPAKPTINNLLKRITINPQLPDSIKPTAATTDGTYLYFGNMWWFATQTNRKSMIYKVGTGNNGTVEGQFYGTFSNFRDSIFNSIVYHSDGYIYVPTGKSHQITRINVATEEIDTVVVPPGLLRWENSTATDGPVYLNSDGNYVYNLTLLDSIGNHKYTLRTFDPSNNWSLAKPDIILSGTSYDGFSGFFVHGDYVYPARNQWGTVRMRRIRLSDGLFEAEWVIVPYSGEYAWCLDWENDKIYASTHAVNVAPVEPKFHKFAGYYTDTNGEILTKPVGPIAWWNHLEYDLYKPTDTGDYQATLFGFNSRSSNWDTLKVNVPSFYSLSNVIAKEYPKLKLNFSLTDSSLGSTEPMELKSVNFDYQQLPDVLFVKDDMQFSPDSSLQGFPITMSFKAKNYGPTIIDSLHVSFYLNGEDSVIYSKVVSVPADSISENISYIINSDHLLFANEIRAFGTTDQLEYFDFNNLIENQFFVTRDSIKPVFSVTFDGAEIINGDIISAKPDIEIILEDNSPLPLDTSFFTIVYDDTLLFFTRPDINYTYTAYPESRAEIHWTPDLPDGKHELKILAKDASNNFFDSTSSITTFYVFNESDLTKVFNYPNPFTNETNFTFSLRGTELPEEVKIKIYTITGRLIRDINLPGTNFSIGFNKIYWNGRDQDGDEIANGVYLYKLIAKFPDKTIAVTQKLARVR